MDNYLAVLIIGFALALGLIIIGALMFMPNNQQNPGPGVDPEGGERPRLGDRAHPRPRSRRKRISPTWISSPNPSGPRPSTGTPLTNVPLVLLRSSTYQLRPR